MTALKFMILSRNFSFIAVFGIDIYEPNLFQNFKSFDTHFYKRSINSLVRIKWKTSNEMPGCLHKEINEIPISFIRNSYSNFVHRCEVCVSQNGGHIELLL